MMMDESAELTTGAGAVVHPEIIQAARTPTMIAKNLKRLLIMHFYLPYFRLTPLIKIHNTILYYQMSYCFLRLLVK
jgi:hypothetical protein